jgi:hypothetical protein
MDSNGNDIVGKVRRLLRENSNEETRIGSRRFFKENEQVLVYGVKSTAVRKIAKAVFAEIKGLPRNDYTRFATLSGNQGTSKKSARPANGLMPSADSTSQRTFLFLRNGSMTA